jgi:hypothetical protein
VPIVEYRGEGLLASVDGLRFVVPKRTINAGPSPKYYHFKRGITWLNADVARLSPLEHANLNVLGRYSFRASVPAGGGLRPLRDPATADADEEG